MLNSLDLVEQVVGNLFEMKIVTNGVWCAYSTITRIIYSYFSSIEHL